MAHGCVIGQLRAASESGEGTARISEQRPESAGCPHAHKDMGSAQDISYEVVNSVKASQCSISLYNTNQSHQDITVYTVKMSQFYKSMKTELIKWS